MWFERHVRRSAGAGGKASLAQPADRAPSRTPTLGRTNGRSVRAAVSWRDLRVIWRFLRVSGLAPRFCLNRRRQAGPVLAAICGVSVDFCGHTKFPRRDAHDAFEVIGELALVREPCPDGDFR